MPIEFTLMWFGGQVSFLNRDPAKSSGHKKVHHLCAEA